MQMADAFVVVVLASHAFEKPVMENAEQLKTTHRRKNMPISLRRKQVQDRSVI
jgi:hypothetical protein